MKFGLACAPALALDVCGTANAAVSLDFDGSDGVFGDDNVTAVTCSDEFIRYTGVSAGQLSAADCGPVGGVNVRRMSRSTTPEYFQRIIVSC